MLYFSNADLCVYQYKALIDLSSLEGVLAEWETFSKQKTLVEYARMISFVAIALEEKKEAIATAEGSGRFCIFLVCRDNQEHVQGIGVFQQEVKKVQALFLVSNPRSRIEGTFRGAGSSIMLGIFQECVKRNCPLHFILTPSSRPFYQKLGISVGAKESIHVSVDKILEVLDAHMAIFY